jgi:hypothetical protein
MSAPEPNSLKRSLRRYLVELSIAMVLFVVAIFIRGWLLRGPMLHSELNWTLLIVALLPDIPVALMMVAVVRCLRSVDEMMRRIQTESLAIAGGVTAIMAVTYGLLEGPHFPVLSAWWTYIVFMATWLVATFIRQWRYC